MNKSSHSPALTIWKMNRLLTLNPVQLEATLDKSLNKVVNSMIKDSHLTMRVYMELDSEIMLWYNCKSNG